MRVEAFDNPSSSIAKMTKLSARIFVFGRSDANEWDIPEIFGSVKIGVPKKSKDGLLLELERRGVTVLCVVDDPASHYYAKY